MSARISGKLVLLLLVGLCIGGNGAASSADEQARAPLDGFWIGQARDKKGRSFRVQFVLARNGGGQYTGHAYYPDFQCTAYLREKRREGRTVVLSEVVMHNLEVCRKSYVYMTPAAGDSARFSKTNRHDTPSVPPVTLTRVPRGSEEIVSRPGGSWTTFPSEPMRPKRLPRKFREGYLARASSLQEQCYGLLYWGHDRLPFISNVSASEIYDSHILVSFETVPIFGVAYLDMRRGDYRAVRSLAERCARRLNIEALDPENWYGDGPFSVRGGGDERALQRIREATVRMEEQLSWADQAIGRIRQLPPEEGSLETLRALEEELAERRWEKLGRVSAARTWENIGKLSPRYAAQVDAALAAKRSEVATPVVAALKDRIAAVPVAASALRNVRELASDLASRSDRLPESEEERLRDLLGEKRRAIEALIERERQLAARQEVAQALAGLDRIPDQPTSLAALQEVVAKIAEARLDEAMRREAERKLAAKVEAIIAPSLAEAVARSAQWPETLAGARAAARQTAELSRTVVTPLRSLGQAARRVDLDLEPEAVRKRISQVRDQRATLLESARVQSEFRDAMFTLTPQRDLRGQLRREATQYVPSGYLDDSSAYARIVDAAYQRLELAAIPLSDTSVGGPSGQPDAREMLVALKAAVDNANRNFESWYHQCRNRGFERNPLLVPICVVILPVSPDEPIRIKVNAFEKVGCGKPEGAVGFWCQYDVNTHMTGGLYNLPQLQRLLQSFEAGGGWFVPTRDGWRYQAES